MSDPVALTRYPAVDVGLLDEVASLGEHHVHAACRLPSGRVLSVHTERRPWNGAGASFAVPTLVVWQDGKPERLLEGLGDIGYFEHSHTHSHRKLTDVAELADGGLVALVWGDNDADGMYRLIHDTYLWSATAAAPEVLSSVAWQDDGFELLLWECAQTGGPVAGAKRAPFHPDRVIRRLRLA